MTIRVKIRHDRQIICPVRFTRAVTGAPQADAPEVDDRGFAMGARQGTWGNSPARGAMVSIATGDTVRVRLLREDIDATAPIFMTSTDTAVVEVVEPVGGGPLPADGVFKIRGVADFANRPVSVQARLGDAHGPVIGELEPHVFNLRVLRVVAHLVSINGVSTARTAATLTTLFDEANAIWRPAGIRFLYGQTQTRTTPVNGFSVAGQMTTTMNAGTPGHVPGANNWNEFSTIINTNVRANYINVYFVRQANEIRGLTYANDVARPNGYGIVLVDGADANDLAHELLHFLDTEGHADDPVPATANAKVDMWARRRLMYAFNPYGASGIAHRDDVGYGNIARGSLITVKNTPNTVEANDAELERARARSLNPY